ncbi:uncharacterized protein LOC133330558 [Musca vetustissima]|uniref:uncharacterized protein LOC133330558 n=1 Tax=Musca vetustissima TaxID=27455 RepID=UPI002AB7D97E|nr:uncharacterized protein LOC133330558 [Musca vetustissima]
MNKLSFILLICCSAMVFADRPDWYPEDEAAIEAKCREDNSISDETAKQIWSNNIEDNHDTRNFFLCLAEKKNIFSTETGFKPDRLLVVLKERAKLDCKPEFIEGCAEKGKDVTPDDAKMFTIMKCTVAGAEENCKKVEEN